MTSIVIGGGSLNVASTCFAVAGGGQDGGWRGGLVEGTAHVLPRERRPLGEALADALTVAV
jgi:hypothetical protein